MRLAATLCALAVTASGGRAHADGFYYGQSYGVSSARADGSAMLGGSLQLRIQLGWRWGDFSVGPTFTGNLAAPRDGSTFGIVGGKPPAGDSDFESLGGDVRYNQTIVGRLSAYVRGGPRVARGMGALSGYYGVGLGAGTGIQVTGQVRALGFLFAPLFFSKRGPRINACVFLDQNVDWFHLANESNEAMPSLSMPIVATSIGIGAGSYF